MEEISNYSGPKLIITNSKSKLKAESSAVTTQEAFTQEETPDHLYNADLDLDSTDSTEVSV